MALGQLGRRHAPHQGQAAAPPPRAGARVVVRAARRSVGAADGGSAAARPAAGAAQALGGAAQALPVVQAPPKAAPPPPVTAVRQPPPSDLDGGGSREHTVDYVVIGSGIGGLCCAALLARYGYSVTVVESHYLAGGAAHSFDVRGPSGTYRFDAGPSYHIGLMDERSSNPLKQVLDLLGESVECARYSEFVLHPPGMAPFTVVADRQEYEAAIARAAGPQAAAQLRALEAALAPLQRGAALFPAAAIRSDPGFLLTAARFLGPEAIALGLRAKELTGPFSAIVDRHVTDPWLRSLLDLECFVLSGMLARDTLCAEMAMMFEERARGRNRLDYPMGGSASIIDALVRGLRKHGGRLLLRSHVDEIVFEGGRAAGVALRPRDGGGDSANGNGSSGGGGRREVIRARRGVVSNASVWDTAKLLPPGAAPPAWRAACEGTPATHSFVHLHLGIDARGLPDDLECHHLFVDDWANLTAPQNVRIASIPTVFDPSLAPPGKAIVHAYVAANEPYELWEGLARGSPEYAAMKDERSQCLWEALERVIPDIRARAEVSLVGTPLTHERFLRRHRGTYGPAISARTGSWPGARTPVPGLSVCGDSTMPGIGVPAAAASGMIAANSLAPVLSHLSALSELRL